MSEDTEPQQADFITILPSDTIAAIVEEHFNKKLYKQRVQVIDTKATEAGYMFSLMFVKVTTEQPYTEIPYPRLGKGAHSSPFTTDRNGSITRDSKGKFVKREV